MRTNDGWDEALDKFANLIGLDKLPVIHLNDSMTDIGSNRDRHENIGKGFIGDAGFKVILNNPKVEGKVGILEVPGIDKKGPDKPNLDKLAQLTD